MTSTDTKNSASAEGSKKSPSKQLSRTKVKAQPDGQVKAAAEQYIPSRTKAEAAGIVARLEELYPDAQCSLEYGGDPWRLLVAARLSAQCTDARVNLVCRDLFDRFPDADALSDADLAGVEGIVRPCGLFHVKSADIIGISRAVCDMGGVPSDMDALLSLPGVGRKIANLIRGDVFALPAVVTDTHCIRICRRLGFYGSLSDPAKIERVLAGVIEPDRQSDFCHRLVLFGRDTCAARSPLCDGCGMAAWCVERRK